ncbi:protein ARV1-like [Actinia tenebrosa]|uniref:Protein ARV n=1 Tax=Actinia tenebrosa TaxID=6105 RepID=A0A6P8H1S7_ACTTE|nr:protein ARV1-like [Actinia tenebrosa]
MATAGECVCVECGKHCKSKKLYRKFQGGAIRLLFCESCNQVMDKYLEYDPVLICLDILLHKPQAYRHVLFNIKPKIEWHLCVLYLLSDAYMKWSDVNYSQYPNKTLAGTLPDHSVLELEFYYIFLSQSCIEYLSYLFGLLLGIKVFLSLTSNNKKVSYRKALVAVLLSSFGKLLVIPVVLWADPSSSQLCLWLIKLFVLTSNAEAIHVVLDINFWKASILVSFGFLTSLICENGKNVLPIAYFTNHFNSSLRVLTFN